MIDEANIRIVSSLGNGLVRCWMASILPIRLPKSVYVNSEAYAALRGYSRRRTTSSLTFLTSIPAPSLPVIVMCSRGHYDGSKVYIKRVQMCARDNPQTTAKVGDWPHRFPCSPTLTKLTDLPPRGHSVETHDTSKHHSILGCHRQSPPVHLGLDAWRDSSGIHQE